MIDDITTNRISSNIDDLVKNISDQRFSHWYYPRDDLLYMALMVKQANTKYPQLNLYFVDEVGKLGTTIRNIISGGAESARIVVNFAKDGIHFAALDYAVIGNRKSVILFESTSFDPRGGQKKLVERVRDIIGEMNSGTMAVDRCCFTAAEMSIQKSATECGIFSLAIAKKLYRQSPYLEKMHRANLNGTLLVHTPELDRVYEDCSTYELGFLPPQEVDKHLPVSFYKHVQSRRRLEQYLTLNPAVRNEIINKKGETIFERLENNAAEDYSGKNISISIQRKRITEYRNILRMMGGVES